MKLEWLVIKWKWYGKKNQVLSDLALKLILSYCLDIELKVTGPSYQTYLVFFKNFLALAQKRNLKIAQLSLLTGTWIPIMIASINQLFTTMQQ